MNECKCAEFGKRLKAMRELKQIKQGKFADKVGVSRQSIGNYEGGKQYPTIEIIIKMADCLDCSLDYLLGHPPPAQCRQLPFRPPRRRGAPGWHG